MNEIVVIMGMSASGKSKYADPYLQKGYHRLNRDEIGGGLNELLAHLDSAKKSGLTQIVMDNTYMTKESRKPVIEWGKSNGFSVHCILIDASFEDAQLNACMRMIARRGRLLMPEDFKSEKDPNLFPPAVLFTQKKVYEKPDPNEGWDKIVKHAFHRQWGEEYKNSALILDCDGVLRHSKGKEKFPCSPDEVDPISGRGEIVRERARQFDYLLGVSNQSGIAKKKLTDDQCRATFAKTNELTGLDIDWLYCPHNVPPVNCYCRKPHPGLGAVLIEKYKLLPSKCVYIGDQTTDATFAKRCGFQFIHESEFFK